MSQSKAQIYICLFKGRKLFPQVILCFNEWNFTSHYFFRIFRKKKPINDDNGKRGYPRRHSLLTKQTQFLPTTYFKWFLLEMEEIVSYRTFFLIESNTGTDRKMYQKNVLKAAENLKFLSNIFCYLFALLIEWEENDLEFWGKVRQ
jgi:hypothetical protein